MKRCFTWAGGGVLLAMLAAAIAAPTSDTETRVFRVMVDGKPVGEATFVIQRRDDGSTVVNCDTDVRLRVLLYNFRYTYRGREEWKDGRLVRFDSTCNDDGKRGTVSAIAQADGLRVQANNRQRLVRSDAWLTSYWTLPDPKLRGGLLTLLDADNGREFTARLQLVGPEQVTVAGRPQNTAHYRLNGKSIVDLWYDAGERLVRQEWIEDGHRTALELVQIRR